MTESRRPQDKWRLDKSSAGGRPSGSGGRSRTAKLFLSLFVFAAIVGVVLGFLYFITPEPKPYFFSLAVTEYDNSFPVNAFGQQDSEALWGLFPPEDREREAFKYQERLLILSKFDELASRSRTENQLKGRALIVHFSANALVSGGTVYVLPGTAKPGVPETWIRLEELLNKLKEVHCLLLLDLRPVVDARLGVLADDLPNSVQELLARIQPELSFPVLVACGPGATPFFCRELKRSAFGWFLERGLAGEADGWSADGKKDLNVSDRELLDFTRDNVYGFTSKLGQAQLPVLHNQKAGKEYIVLPKSDRQANPVRAEAADEYPPWLVLGWKERDAWRKEGVHLRLPRTYRQLEAALLRAEAQWLGGGNLEAASRNLENEKRELTIFKNKYGDKEPVKRSLAIARKLKLLKNRESAKDDLEPILGLIRALPPAAKKEDLVELDKLQQALSQKPIDAIAAADVLFAEARELPNPTLAKLDQVVRTLDKLPKTPPLPKFAEISLLRFIVEAKNKEDQYDTRNRWASEAGTYRLILLAAEAAENAIAVDGRALPWLKAALEETDRRRRDALVQLFGDTDQRKEGRKNLEACLEPYQKIGAAGKHLGDAFHQWEETSSLLASWAGFEAPDPAVQALLEKYWDQLVDQAQKLLPLLKPPAEPRLPDADVEELANNLGAIGKNIEAQLKAPPPGIGAVDARRWLAWPLWTAEQRQQLAAIVHNNGVDPIQKALAAERGKPGQTPQSLPVDAAAKNRLALRRARQALDLLKLTGDPEQEKLARLEKQYREARDNPEPRSLQDLGWAIAQRWTKDLPERYGKAAAAERVECGWAIHPWDLFVKKPNQDEPLDAAPELMKRQIEFADWIGSSRDSGDAGKIATIATQKNDPGASNLSSALGRLASEQRKWPGE